MGALIYDLVYMIPLCTAASILACSFAGPEEGRYAAFAAVIVAVLVTLLMHLKTRGRILMLGIAAVTVIGTIFSGKRELLTANMWILNVLLVCAVCLVIYKGVSLDIRIKAALPAASAVVLAILTVQKREAGKTLFMCLSFIMIIYVAEVVQSRWKKEGDTDTPGHIVYILPLVLLVMIPVAFAKIPDKPFDWGFVRGIATDIRDEIASFIETITPGQGWDGGDNMGFSERASVGGSLRGNPYKALTVSSSTQGDYRIYLAGKSFDTFSGRTWTKTDESDTDYMSYDLLGTYAAVMMRYPGDEDELIRPVRMRIKYDGVRTKYAFAPFKSSPDTTVDTVQYGGDLKLLRGRRSDYYVDYLRLNRTDERLTKILNDGGEVNRQSFEEASERLSGMIKSRCTYEGYEQFRNAVYEHYLEQPVLSDRAASLMESILDGAKSDHEKLLRIEKLLGGYKYTATPGDLPETVKTAGDYIDYLLFEKKEGYCTYFATAFVLLARSQGIPARYVQGYSTLASTTGFEVMSDRAHAWPEAYIDGVGWMVYEPTPGYRQESGWEISQAPREGYGSSFHTIYDGVNDTDTKEEITGPQNGISSSDHSWIGVMLIALLSFLIVFAVSDRVYRRYRYSRMDDREKIISICSGNMRLLKLAGVKIRRGETLREYAKRAKETVPGRLLAFTDVYEQALYAPEQMFKSGSYQDVLETLYKDRKELMTAIISSRVHAPFSTREDTSSSTPQAR